MGFRRGGDAKEGSHGVGVARVGDSSVSFTPRLVLSIEEGQTGPFRMVG